MGALIKFTGPDDGLPQARHNYVRHAAEVRGLENERAKQEAMKAKLEGELAKFEDAGQEVDNLLNQGAESLLAKLRAGLDPVLSSLGGKAADLDARRAASVHSAEIVRRAIGAIDTELEILSVKLGDLEDKKGDLILRVIHEAAGEPLRVERAAAIDNLREVLTRQAALERVLEPQRHDYVPSSRIVVSIPSLVWADQPPTEIILAPGREIQAAAQVLGRFALALDSDPLTPAPSFPDVDPRPDEGAIYHELSAPERAQIARDTVHTNEQRDDTPEPRNIFDAAKAAFGF